MLHVRTYLVGPHSLVADPSVNRTFDNSGNQFGNVLFLLFLARNLLHCKTEAKRMNLRGEGINGIKSRGAEANPARIRCRRTAAHPLISSSQRGSWPFL